MFVHPSINRHLDCIYLLAIVTSYAVNIDVQISETLLLIL